jgi:hypothetical protein
VIGVGHEGQDPKEAKGRVADDAPDALDALQAFLQQHIAADECPASGLTCILGPTSTAKARSKKWNRAQLHEHLKSKAHSRSEKLINAFNKLKAANESAEKPKSLPSSRRPAQQIQSGCRPSRLFQPFATS